MENEIKEFIPLSEFVELTDNIETIRKYAKLCKSSFKTINDSISNCIYGDTNISLEQIGILGLHKITFTKPLNEILEKI